MKSHVHVSSKLLEKFIKHHCKESVWSSHCHEFYWGFPFRVSPENVSIPLDLFIFADQYGIWVYSSWAISSGSTLCKRIHLTKPLFATMDVSKFRDRWAHFRNSGMKGLKSKLKDSDQTVQLCWLLPLQHLFVLAMPNPAVYIPCIGTPYLHTILVVKFEQVHFAIYWCV